MNFKLKVVQNDYKKLAAFANGLVTHQIMYTLGTEAKAVITTRTQLGKDENEQAFTPYSTKRYYAPIDTRPVGYPQPSGGRRKGIGAWAKRTLKTMAFDQGYGQYHVGIGRGPVPTLSVSNRMQNEILVTTPNEKTAMLSFASKRSEIIAGAHDGGLGKAPQRKWFGIGSLASRQQIAQKYAQLIRELKTRLGL